MRKGFFFVVCVLIILVYILSNLSLWSKSVQIQEERYSEEFRISNIRYVAGQLDQEFIDDFSYKSATYALYKLNEHSIDSPVNEGPLNDEYSYINQSIRDLMLYGYAKDSYFETSGLTYGQEENYSYSFYGMFSRLNKTFSMMGMELTEPKIENFNFNQTSIDTMNVSFDISFEAFDRLKRTTIQRSFSVSFNFSIQGLVDPSVSREMKKLDPNAQVYKQIFFHTDESFIESDFQELYASPSGSGKGQGWFYGEVLDASASNINDPSIISQMILKGTIQEISANPDKSLYGAYYVTENPDNFQEALSSIGKDRPLFISSSSGTNECNKGKQCLLFVSEYDVGDANVLDPNKNSQAQSYNIENFRDFLICGYYVYTPDGPSYLDKLLKNSYSRNNAEYGVATFLVWNGIEQKEELRDKSRLDLEFFDSASPSAYTVRGMPGCKDQKTCSLENGKFLGKFKLSAPSLQEYLGGDASSHFICQTWADCEGD